jgi:hypothetical protein
MSLHAAIPDEEQAEELLTVDVAGRSVLPVFVAVKSACSFSCFS